MPSGKTHALVTTVAAGVLGPVLIFGADIPIEMGLAFMGGCLTGLVINPDLDIDQGSRSHALVRRSTGCLGVAAWSLFWWPYARLLPHRSFFSHFPVVGTLGRLLYLFGLPALIWYGFSLAVEVGPLPKIAYSPAWLWAVLGLVIVDALHAVLDWFPLRLSRIRRFL